MLNILRRGALALSMCTFLAGCSSTPEPEPERGMESRGTNYLERGPTVALDEPAAPTNPTTLQILEQRVQENARLKEQMKNLEAELETASKRAADCESHMAKNGKESQELKGLLERALAQQKDLTEQLLAARIARLRLEQEMIRLKLANSVQDGE